MNTDDCFMTRALQILYIFSWILCPLVLIQDFLLYNDVLALCLVSYPYAIRLIDA